MNIYFPMFVNLSEKEVLVFGGGNVASRRVKALVESEARVRVIAPEISAELKKLSQESDSLILEYRTYRPSELREPAFVLAATDDEAVNEGIVRECRHKEILVNTSSNQEQCDFFFPGIVREGEVTIGVTANGQDHKKAAQVTESVRRLLKGE